MPEITPSRLPIPSVSRRHFSLAITAAATSVGGPLFAQSTWPNKPIRIIVPYTPGGFTDQMARLVQVGLQNRLQQTVTIDNKPGANSIIGVDLLAKAPADGSTFAVVIAAYAVGVVATLALVGWVWTAMVRAEKRRDQSRGK